MKVEGYLIDAVKKHPVLYDRYCDGYNSRDCIERAWTLVAKEVNKYVKNINVTHCKLRWRTLRDRFVRDYAKAADGTRQPWIYYNKISFLARHLQKRNFFQQLTSASTGNSMKKQIESRKIKNLSKPNNKTREFNFVQVVEEPPSGNKFQQQLQDEPEIEMPMQSFQRSDSSEDSICNLNLEDSSDVEPKNEDCLENLLKTTNNLLQQVIKQNTNAGSNEAYFKVLDEHFQRLPPRELDRVKIEILNLLIIEERNISRNRK